MKWLGPLGGGPASGTLGTMVASHNKGGQYLRVLSIPTNPNTPRQQASKGAMSQANDLWKNQLTFIQRADWDSYAQQTPIPNVQGKMHNIGGKDMFARAMNGRFSIGFGPLNFLAPPTPGVAVNASIVLTGDTANGIEVSVGVPVFDVGNMIFVRISPAVNQTKNQFSSPYTFVTAVTVATVQPVLIRADVDVSIGQRYFVSARHYTFDNRVSFVTQEPVDILT